ncbi:MAG: GMC family oxidoreductase N-terminal domain-containing protein [Sphingomonadaceae bacterium]|jgi:choline dehydrogenase-like flavoprotein|nr:GMC family oxidoreductase N-terminal domain-containing protein [Sphingomonadaceae bacterium]
MEFDYVIVGAGSAGSVVANRLSADPSVTVALIEAGGNGRSWLVDVPGAFGLHASLKSHNWAYDSLPCPGTANRVHFCPRGKGVGGSSSINGMIYIRGAASDYDHWAQLGNRGWSYADVLPYFRRAEANSRGGSAYHGNMGPLPVTDVPTDYAMVRAFVAAGVEAGHLPNADFNGPETEGVGEYQFTINNGRRAGVRAAYIDPIISRSNLTILTNCRATRINLREGRASSVAAEQGGVPLTVTARREIILSGGAYATPQLLMLSGIGPGDALAEHGIAVQHELPGVGRNLIDHPDVNVAYRSLLKDGFSLAPRGLLHLLGDLGRYVRNRSGRLAQSLAPAGGFIRSASHIDVPDLQLHFVPTFYDDYGRAMRALAQHALSCHVYLARPKSVGWVRLASADPRYAPAIQLNMLDDPDDVRALVNGLRHVRDIMRQPSLAGYVGEEILPGMALTSDAELEAFVRNTCQHAYHPVGTARMGSDPMAVVDSNLRVHGIDGLRIADASVMPMIVSGNTNAACIMIGEKCADLVSGAAALPREEFEAAV